jgi:hypothetical protein
VRAKAEVLLRTQHDASDGAVLEQADPPFRRAVGEMGHVDVVAHARHAAKRHGAQRARAGDVIE